jgi:hypothetical protein
LCDGNARASAGAITGIPTGAAALRWQEVKVGGILDAFRYL